MNIEDFLPKYPNINQSKYNVLNAYDDNFNSNIYHKKEFYDNRLERIEKFPSERGILLKHQTTIARYLSSHTLYDKLLLVHSMGSGKTCSAIGAIEQIRMEKSTINGAIVVAKGQALLDNFAHELAFKCTAGQYIPDNYKKLTEGQKIHRLRKKREDFYTFKTMQKFSKEIKEKKDKQLLKEYSNKIIIIDEVHNLRIQPEKKQETLEVYKQFWRLLHLVENCKILLLSGTPMKDGPEEIASVMNLILPENEQLPFGMKGEAFLNEFMTEEKGVYKLQPNKISVLANKFKGRVSFLREMKSDVKVNYIGKRVNNSSLKHLIVEPVRMSSFQSRYYTEAYNIDRSGQKGIYNKSKEASLFVYPNGSYGGEGFKKYITENIRKKTFDIQNKKGKQTKIFKKKYSMNDELRSKLKGKNDEETLQNIEKYSSKYAKIIRELLNRKKQCCFIYSSIVHGSGSILFSLLLQLFGYSKANGNESGKERRYAILTGDTTSKTEIKKIQKRFNRADNMYGEYIQIIIGSKSVSEGLSFSHIRFETILTPHFNYSETAQALARGIRLGSHIDLINSGVTPVVDIMQIVSIPRSNVLSIDLYLYELSEDKDISIRQIIRIIMQAAFDCALNYFRNHITGKDNERDCDYTTCEYECDGINMKAVQEGLQNDELDYSTYQLYYANPQNKKIYRRIEQKLRQNIRLDIPSIVKSLSTEFTEWEIVNALQTLSEQKDIEEYDYRQFLKVYSRSAVRKIMKDVENLFKNHFSLELSEIKNYFSRYTDFEVITALNTVINENIIIINRYGFPSYLKEDNNIYFLVNNLTIADNFFSLFYTEYPTVVTNKSFQDVIKDIYNMLLPSLVSKVGEVKTNTDFSRIIKSLPIEVQELFIENSINADEQGIESKIKDLTLEYFKGYIKHFNGVWSSDLLRTLRCKTEGETWEDCPSNYADVLREKELERLNDLRENNPYGIIGKYNPENGKFCLIDINKEAEGKKKLQQKKENKNNDTRVVNPGKVCSDGGWKLYELIDIMVNRLKVNPPQKFMNNNSEEELRELLKNKSQLKMVRQLFTTEDIENMDKEMLLRSIYWGLPPGAGGMRRINSICDELYKWLKDKGMIIIDNQCGMQGKIKGTKTKQLKEKVYRIEKLVPSKSAENFRSNRQIEKLMKDCFKVEKFSYEITDDTWYMAYLKNNLVGFIVVRDSYIIQACVGKNYKKQGIPKHVMGLLTQAANSKIIKVENIEKNYKSILRSYKSMGFTVTNDNGQITLLTF